MDRIPFDTLKNEFRRVLIKYGFSEAKAELCANTFAANSRDGVHSHGLNRFPVFMQYVKDGLVKPGAEPVLINRHGNIEHWNGQLGAGMYNAALCMDRAISLAKENGIGCVSIKNTNHWMRGGTYGWQAAEAGCIGICFTNTVAGMPAWGGVHPVLGNNPLVIAVPHRDGHIILDMAMSQFSYGKLQEYELKGQQMPVIAGHNEQGNLTTDPAAVRKTKRAIPIGFWKGSALAMVLDILLAALAGGRTTGQITQSGREYGLSQCFICIDQPDMHPALIEEVIRYTKEFSAQEGGADIRYPGENMLRKRIESKKNGVEINAAIWEEVKSM